jgi:hypothetical protein
VPQSRDSKRAGAYAAWAKAPLLLLTLALTLSAATPAQHVIQLPAGVVNLDSEIHAASDTEVRGDPAGTVLRVTGRAAIVAEGSNIRIHDLTIEGSEGPAARLPGYDVPFARFTRGNGILALGVDGLTVERVQVRKVSGFAILVNASRHVEISDCTVDASGGRNSAGRNNTTGGILLEEGTADFHVTRCRLSGIRGNGIWTHSLYTSPRNGPGAIANNWFHNIGRDAIQVGHALSIRVEGNTGDRIGFPIEDVDIESRAIPVAIDTAGNVSGSVYTGNQFREVNGKCIDLDGFHDGEISRNTCANSAAAEAYPFGGYSIVMNNTNPDMRSQNVRITDNEIDGSKFGGIFVIGTGNHVEGNRMRRLNLAHCNEEAARFGCYYAAGQPDLLQSGIYLGSGAERPAPARGNVIAGNEISGFKMEQRCVALAPGIAKDWNTVRDNVCRQP